MSTRIFYFMDSPFLDDCKFYSISKKNHTIRDCVSILTGMDEFQAPTICFLGDTPILRKHWDTPLNHTMDNLVFLSIPTGDNAGKIIVSTLIVAGMSALGGVIGTSIAGSLFASGTFGYLFTQTAIQTAFAVAGGFLVSSIFPVEDEEEKKIKNYSHSTRNRLIKEGDVLNVVYGRYRIEPKLFPMSYFKLTRNEEFFYGMYFLSFGEVTFAGVKSFLKLGKNSVSSDSSDFFYKLISPSYLKKIVQDDTKSLDISTGDNDTFSFVNYSFPSAVKLKLTVSEYRLGGFSGISLPKFLVNYAHKGFYKKKHEDNKINYEWFDAPKISIRVKKIKIDGTSKDFTKTFSVAIYEEEPPVIIKSNKIITFSDASFFSDKKATYEVYAKVIYDRDYDEEIKNKKDVFADITLHSFYGICSDSLSELYPYQNYTMLITRIKASSLANSSSINKLSVDVTRKLPNIDFSSTGKIAETKKPRVTINDKKLEKTFNPALALLDIVRNDYGLGLPVLEYVDIGSLKDFYDYSHSNLNEGLYSQLNCNITKSYTVWDLFELITKISFSKPIFKYNRLYFITERLGREPSLVLTSNSIVEGSLSVSYKLVDKLQSYSKVNIEYISNRTWEQTVFNYTLSGIQSNNVYVSDEEKSNSISVRIPTVKLFGSNSLEQVKAFGRRYLMSNFLRRRVYTFRTELDGFLCTIGDIITIKTSLDLTTFSGVCVSVDVESNTLISSRPIPYSDKEFLIFFRTTNGNYTKGALCSLSAMNPNKIFLKNSFPDSFLKDVDLSSIKIEYTLELARKLRKDRGKKLLVTGIEPKLSNNKLEVEITGIDEDQALFESNKYPTLDLYKRKVAKELGAQSDAIQVLTPIVLENSIILTEESATKSAFCLYDRIKPDSSAYDSIYHEGDNKDISTGKNKALWITIIVKEDCVVASANRNLPAMDLRLCDESFEYDFSKFYGEGVFITLQVDGVVIGAGGEGGKGAHFVPASMNIDHYGTTVAFGAPRWVRNRSNYFITISKSRWSYWFFGSVYQTVSGGLVRQQCEVSSGVYSTLRYAGSGKRGTEALWTDTKVDIFREHKNTTSSGVIEGGFGGDFAIPKYPTKTTFEGVDGTDGLGGNFIGDNISDNLSDFVSNIKAKINDKINSSSNSASPSFDSSSAKGLVINTYDTSRVSDDDDDIRYTYADTNKKQNLHNGEFILASELRKKLLKSPIDFISTYQVFSGYSASGEMKFYTRWYAKSHLYTSFRYKQGSVPDVYKSVKNGDNGKLYFSKTQEKVTLEEGRIIDLYDYTT